jgi:hypothetical protein
MCTASAVVEMIRNADLVQLQLVDVRRELFDQSIHTYQKIYVVWGRKPES